MVVRKLTTGSEAEHILGELARVMAWHYGVAVKRVDDIRLDLPEAEPKTVLAVLAGIDPSWATHLELSNAT